MRRSHLAVVALIAFALAVPTLAAQQVSASAPAEATIPRLIKFSGVLKDANGLARIGTVAITFTLNASQQGGDLLWRESQVVDVDEQGHYTVFLGASDKEGLPLDVFSNGKAQWLGIQAQGDEEQPRVLLVAVPYALKAADADTLGGRPISSFVTYEDLAKSDEQRTGRQSLTLQGSSQVSGRGLGSSGTTGSRAATVAGNSRLSIQRNQILAGNLGPIQPNGYETASNTGYGTGTAPQTSGSDNSYFGYNAGFTNSSGMNNSILGSNAGYLLGAGVNNSIFGYQAGYSIGAGGNNAIFGGQAGYYNTANGNSFFGAESGYNNTSALGNAFFGYQAGRANQIGQNNSIVGFKAGLNTTSDGNSFFGNTAGQSNTTGFYNAFFGYQAGYANTSSSYNAFFGTSAGRYSTGEGNSFFGEEAGKLNTSGSYNSFVGSVSGSANTTENYNTYIGSWTDGQAGITNSTAIGYRAKVLQSNSLILGSINGVNGATADTSVGIGTTSPSSGIRLNVYSRWTTVPPSGAVGILSNNVFAPTANSGGFTYGVQSSAQYEGASSLTASHRTTTYALSALQGYYGGTVTSGVGGLGSVATVTGVAAQNILRNSITITDAIGTQIQPAMCDIGAATATNVYGVYVKSPSNITATNVYGLYTEDFTIGTKRYGVYISGNNNSYFGGNVGIGTADPLYKLHVAGNIYATGSYLGSDARLKKNISDLSYGLDEIMQLRPVSYQWKDQTDSRLSLGLIAQEVEPVLPELIEKAKDEAGTMSLNYVGLVPVLIKAMQQDHGKIEAQQAGLQDQQNTTEELQARLAKKDAEIRTLRAETDMLQKQNAALDARLSSVEQLLEQLLKQGVRLEK
jgi:hypothetical protein